jgi:TolA-binding protein
MNQLLVNGITSGSAALMMAGISSFAMSGNPAMSIAGGTLGGIGTVVATQQQNQRLKQKIRSQIAPLEVSIEALQEQHLQVSTQLQQQIATLEQTVTKLSQTEQPLIVLPDDALSTDSSHDQNSPPRADSRMSKDNVLNHQAIAWFKTHHTPVTQFHRTQPEVDEIFDRLAFLLGKGYETQQLKPIYEQLKRAAIQGNQIRMNIANQGRDGIGYWTNFCSILARHSFLSHYHYSSQSKNLHAVIQQRGDIIRFFTGTWLERFVCQTVLQNLKFKRLNYSYLINPHVDFPERNFELDLFFLVQGEPLWIECKTSKAIVRTNFDKKAIHHIRCK